MHRIAVVGVWHVHAADYVAEALQRADVQICGVWDRDHAAAAAFAEARGLRAVRDLDELLSDPAVHAVIVTTATRDHPEVIGRSLDAGKHVFTEKVLAVEPGDAVRLETLAAERGLILVVSFQRLAEAWVPTLLNVVGSGALGRMTSSRIRYQHAGAVEGWLPDGFFSEGEAGGGAVIDLGAHGFYLSQLFHGEFPTSVTCRLSDIAGRGVEDGAVVVLEYQDGTLSVLETSLSSSPNDARWAEVYGTAGVAAVDPRDEVVYVRAADGDDWVPQPMLPSWPTPLAGFLSALEAGSDTAENVARSIRLVSLVSAAYESSRRSATISVSDPFPSSDGLPNSGRPGRGVA